MSETETKSDLEAAFEAASEAVERVTSGSEPADTEVEAEESPAPVASPAGDSAEVAGAEVAGAEVGGAEVGGAEVGGAELAALTAKVAALEAEAAEWKTKAYRATADLENGRRRFQRDREEGRKFAVESLMKDLLPVVDNLERAVGAATDMEDPVVKGVQMVQRQFDTLMKKRGAEAFDPLGEVFDPQFHEAMSQLVSTEYAPGHISQVFQRGWKLHDRLVRPAMVIIAMAPPEEVEKPESEVEAEAPDLESDAALADESSAAEAREETD